ncbi:MAG: tRNA pseudouridine(55) synthase TruB [Eubacteriales bacterium]|nr:tRNA pseudouridine(55) synthase TruB [Eubacteriales bacterium]
MRSGILVIDKATDWTSHDVVNKLRGIFGQKKIGHTGTLDPMATGVLPVCLGRATKLADYVAAGDKTYEAEMTLGLETDTEDSTGTVTRRATVNVSDTALQSVMTSFRGPQLQVPPMYSAIRIGGKRLYEIARTGRTVERPARPITIHALDLQERSAEKIRFTVTCSKGTYVRSLCRDMGRALGCLAVMSALRRTRVGQFTLADAVTMETARERGPGQPLLAMDAALSAMPILTARDETTKRVNNGNPLAFSEVSEQERAAAAETGTLFRMYRADGFFVGLYERQDTRLKPKTILMETGGRNHGVASPDNRFKI